MTVTIYTALFSHDLIAWWFNPKEGHSTKIGKFKNGEQLQLTPPTTGIEKDWVLVIDDITKKYESPR